MAWAKRLLDASFRGVTFDCQLAEDSGERHAVEHARPYVDGAEMEDLGRGARRIRMRAIFFGADYETKLKKFLKALDTPGPGALVHPVFGPLTAQVLPWRVHHDAEGVDQATVELTFAESALSRPIFADSTSKQKAASVAAKTTTTRSKLAAALAKAAAKAKNAQAMARAGLRAIAVFKAQVSSVTTTGADILTSPATWASDLASLITGVVDLRNFDSDSLLPDFSAVYTALTNAILLPSSSSGSGTTSSTSTSTSADSDASLIAGTELDEVRAHVNAERALAVAEAAQEVLESEADTPTLTPDEIESVTADARELLQTSIDTYRSLYDLEDSRPVAEALRDVALAVQTAAEAVLEARPPVVEYTVRSRTCPRLLAHALYGDHTRADEIIRLNDLSDPNFLTAGTALDVYAS